MNEKELSDVRRALRAYYDELKVRMKELEEERPVFKEIIDPLNLFWGVSPYYLVVDRYELRSPSALRNALKFCESELKWWSTREGNDKRLNSHSDNVLEETE